MTRLTLEDVAGSINKAIGDNRLHFVCGLIKDTLPLWDNIESLELLYPEARDAVKHYNNLKLSKEDYSD